MPSDGRALVARQHSLAWVDLLAIRSLPYSDPATILTNFGRLELGLESDNLGFNSALNLPIFSGTKSK